MPGELSLFEATLLMAAVAVGVTVQTSLGFGYALVTAPVLAFVLPPALPGSLLFLAFPLTAYMALRERHALDVRGFAWITAGRLLGTAAGVAILVAVPPGSLSVLFGSMIVLAAALSALGPGFHAGAGTRFVAGAASGLMGTAAAIGGPALGLVYQRRPGPELRATLALSFVVGLLLSLGALLLAGQVHLWQAELALWLLPAMGVGLFMGRLLVPLLDGRWLRPAVLILAAVAGLGVVIEGSVG